MDYAKNFLILGLIAAVAFIVGGSTTQFSYAQAETQTVSFQSDFDFETVSVCGGEALQLGGTAHFVFHQTISDSGISISNTKMNYQKVGGVGLESGKKYQLNEVRSSVTKTSEGDTPDSAIIHSVITGTLLSQGKDTNTKATINLLTVFGGDGDVKTTVEKIDFKCVG